MRSLSQAEASGLAAVARGSCKMDIFSQVRLLIAEVWGSHPFLTPSICKSIHQILGTPRMHHRAAFLPSDPIGSHCSTRKYASVTNINSGRRKQKRNMRIGAWRPSGSDGMGRKGAIPEPVTK